MEAELAVDRQGALILSLYIAPSLLLPDPTAPRVFVTFSARRQLTARPRQSSLEILKVATIPHSPFSPAALSARLVQKDLERPRPTPSEQSPGSLPLFKWPSSQQLHTRLSPSDLPHARFGLWYAPLSLY